jgi:hypothetical protein
VCVLWEGVCVLWEGGGGGGGDQEEEYELPKEMWRRVRSGCRGSEPTIASESSW